jgi:hypothetical protein
VFWQQRWARQQLLIQSQVPEQLVAQLIQQQPSSPLQLPEVAQSGHRLQPPLTMLLQLPMSPLLLRNLPTPSPIHMRAPLRVMKVPPLSSQSVAVKSHFQYRSEPTSPF